MGEVIPQREPIGKRIPLRDQEEIIFPSHTVDADAGTEKRREEEREKERREEGRKKKQGEDK